MSLYRRFDREGGPSFVTTNTFERRRIFTDIATCELLVDILYSVRIDSPFQLLAFTVMPDHLHLILAPDMALGRCVQLIKGRFAREFNQSIGAGGAVWQARYHERTLRSEAVLLRALEYVHENPVAMRLVSSAEDYAWSTASGRFISDLEEFLSG